MKKLLIAGGLALLSLGSVAGGAVWLLQRPVHAGPPEDEGAQSISARVEGEGFRLEIQPGEQPLRTLRWIGPLPDGAAVAQIATQNDRQQVAVFRDGAVVGLFPVPRPAGIGEGFFNHAELLDAVLAEGDLLLLLYRPLGGSEGENALIIGLDLPTKSLRWCHRASGEQFRPAGSGKDASIFLLGPHSPVIRLPLALRKGEKEGVSPVRPGVQSMEMPAEVGEIHDLLPTGAWTFLLAHAKGLSAFLGAEKGWAHLPSPPPSRLGFTERRGVLANTGKRYWWQAEPGSVLEVLPDGTLQPESPPLTLAVPSPTLDGSMLRLIGADKSGALWFGIEAPSLQPPKPPPVSPGETAQPAASEEVPAFTSAELLAWETHLQAGLDRFYRFDLATRALQRFTWSELQIPDTFIRPSEAKGLHPFSGVLLRADQSAIWLPLSALPLKSLGNLSAPVVAVEPARPVTQLP